MSMSLRSASRRVLYQPGCPSSEKLQAVDPALTLPLFQCNKEVRVNQLASKTRSSLFGSAAHQMGLCLTTSSSSRSWAYFQVSQPSPSTPVQFDGQDKEMLLVPRVVRSTAVGPIYTGQASQFTHPVQQALISISQLTNKMNGELKFH